MPSYQIAKAIVIAGFKCPPEVGPAMTMAKIMPTVNANPIWKKLLYAVTPSSFWLLRRKLATDASPGNLDNRG